MAGPGLAVRQSTDYQKLVYNNYRFDKISRDMSGNMAKRQSVYELKFQVDGKAITTTKWIRLKSVKVQNLAPKMAFKLQSSPTMQGYIFHTLQLSQPNFAISLFLRLYALSSFGDLKHFLTLIKT